MIVSVSGTQGRIALLESGRLTEYRTEAAEPLTGHIYKGRVTDIVPDLQAAFVDIGEAKNAFLHVEDAMPPGHRQRGAEKPSISRLVRSGEERLVQVIKEGSGSKGARVTTQLSLPGRLLVYLPSGGGVMLSQKITDSAEQARLREQMAPLLGAGEGVLLRTAARGVPANRLAAELAYLRSVWHEALAAGRELKPPALLWREGNLLERVIREWGTAEPDEVIVDDASALQQVKRLVEAFYPGWSGELRWHHGAQPLFHAFGVEQQLESALQPVVSLPGGGWLVIEQTEALTVIDVNSGKQSVQGLGHQEEAAVRINQDAAAEIARQLRLRDIGGIILIDFINMKTDSARQRVMQILQQELARDRTSSHVLGFTRLGLVELTRKRTRLGLAAALTVPCPCCGGRGRVWCPAELFFRMGSEVRSQVRGAEAEAVLMAVSTHLAGVLERERLEQEWEVTLYIQVDASLPPDRFRLLYAGSKAEAERRLAALAKTDT